MGDGQSHGYKAQCSFEEKAYAKYGHLSKTELIDVGETLHARVQELRTKCKAADDELRAAEYEDELLTTVFIDELNGRRRK